MKHFITCSIILLISHVCSAQKDSTLVFTKESNTHKVPEGLYWRMQNGIDEKYTVFIDGIEISQRQMFEVAVKGLRIHVQTFSKSIQIVGLEDETVTLKIAILKDPNEGVMVIHQKQAALKEMEPNYILIDMED